MYGGVLAGMKGEVKEAQQSESHAFACNHQKIDNSLTCSTFDAGARIVMKIRVCAAVIFVAVFWTPNFTSAQQCHPNYSGACVPVASDVDCAGGSGDGPAYVRGPVRVIGPDVYGLDRDKDGIGCE